MTLRKQKAERRNPETNRKKNTPELRHPHYMKLREKHWQKQGILEPDNSGRFLSWATFQAVMDFQNGRCGVCDRIFFVNDKRGDTADHDHVTGLFRGVLCGGRRGCNWRFVGKVEHFKITEGKPGSGDEAALRFLKDPPAQRWLKARELIDTLKGGHGLPDELVKKAVNAAGVV